VEIKAGDVLKRIGDLEREIEYIKRDLMHLKEKPKQTETSTLWQRSRWGYNR